MKSFELYLVLFLLPSALFYFGCTKDPKIIEEENRQKLKYYINFTNDCVKEIDVLLHKVDSLNAAHISFGENFNPMAELLVSVIKISAIETNISEIPMVVDPVILVKSDWISEFVSITKGKYSMFDKVQQGSMIRYIPSDDIQIVKAMIDRYKLLPNFDDIKDSSKLQ